MKNLIVFIFLLINNLQVFAQLDSSEFFPLEQKKQLEISNLLLEKNSTHTVGTFTLEDKNYSCSVLLQVDDNTIKISNVVPHATKANTWFVYLEGAHKVKLLSYLRGDLINKFRHTVTDDTGNLIGSRDAISSPIKNNNLPLPAQNIFGTFDAQDKIIIFSIYNIDKKGDVKTLIICNKKPKSPILVHAFLAAKNNKDGGFITNVERNAEGDIVKKEKIITEFENINLEGNRIPFSKNRSHVQITVKPFDNIFLYKIIVKRVEKDNTSIITFDGVDWKHDRQNNLSCRLDINNFEVPGEYEVILCPQVGGIDLGIKTENALSIKFKILKPSFFSSLQDVLYFCGGLLILLGLVFTATIFVIKRKNKKKLAQIDKQKEIVKSQLSVVRSQLNPHFLFNALAGIQNLMNKNEIENANKYLAKFARLTRNVLDDKELISLWQEKTLLDDYLQMEQLRFGFKYEINVDKGLDLDNIEIPSMLLQPFVENAVKHGISQKATEGEIKIAVTTQEKNLILTVSDNGNGFDADKNYGGLGLALSKSRVALLNGIYKENQFILAIQSASSGTKITLTLTDWL